MLDAPRPDRAALTVAARHLLPDGVAVAASDPQAEHALQHPAEALAGAAPTRLREYAAGRHAAHAAIAALGQPDQPIPMGRDRAPQWPGDVTGSITHSHTACLAAVSTGHQGIGLDLEADMPLSPELWDTVLLPQERDWLLTQPTANRGRLAMLMFSAKEAGYKAQYPTSQTLLGFDALLIRLGDKDFTAEFQRPVDPFLSHSRLSGRFTHIEGHILTAVAL